MAFKRSLLIVWFAWCFADRSLGQNLTYEKPDPRCIRFGWKGTYDRVLPPKVNTLLTGGAPPIQGRTKGSAGIGTYASYETMYGLLFQIEGELSLTGMGYGIQIPSTAFGLGTEGVDLEHLSYSDLMGSVNLSVGYLRAFDDGLSCFARVSYKRSWVAQPSSGGFGFNGTLANGENVTVLHVDMDWNSDGGSFGAITAEAGIGLALSKNTEIRLLLGGDYYPNAFANGTFTVLPEDPQHSTSGTIRFSGSAWYVGMSLGLVVPW